MNIRRVATLGLFVVITAAGAVACTTSGGGGGGGGGGSFESAAGWTALEWNVLPGHGGLAITTFYGSGASISTGSPSHGCLDVSTIGENIGQALTPTPITTGTLTITGDAGASVQLVNGGTTLTMVNPFDGTYNMNPSTQPPGGDYDFVIPGGADIPAQTITAALFMPQLPTLPPMTTIAVNGSGITWTPAGGDFALVGLGDSPLTAFSAFCITDDDGAFTLPSSVRDDVPNGTGTIVVESRAQRDATVDGRTMVFVGEVVSAGSYTK